MQGPGSQLTLNDHDLVHILLTGQDLEALCYRNGMYVRIIEGETSPRKSCTTLACSTRARCPTLPGCLVDIPNLAQLRQHLDMTCRQAYA